MGAQARLQLARALALSGDMVKAKSTYDDLFILWKSADPDIPVLRKHGRNTRDYWQAVMAARRSITMRR